jgi:hypothetical protein
MVFIDISLPLARVQPWILHRMVVLVDLERKMREMQATGRGDNVWDLLLLRKLL